MGCGGSVEQAAPIEEPEDPMVKLLEEIARLRGDLSEALPKLASSAHKWRYVSSTMSKLNQLNHHFANDVADEDELHKALTYHIAEQDAQDLYDASAGFGTDEEKMGKVILGRLRENIELTDQIYQKRHGRTLEDLVRGENKTLLGLLGADSLSHFGRFLTYRTAPAAKRDALIMRKAMSGMGCSDFMLVEVLSTRTNDELKAAAEVYAAEFEEDMVERIKKETGGFGKQWYGKWIDTLVEFDRDETFDVPDNVEELAKQLYDAGAGKWMGCDEQVFIDILNKANEPTCLAIAAAYEALEDTKNTLAEDVEKKMGGDLEFSVLARVRPKKEFYAVRLYKACKGFGTDEECICRVLGCMSNKEVIDLAESYNALYADAEAPFNDFKTMVESELSGSLLDGILHLLESTPPKSHWDSKTTYPGNADQEADHFKGHLAENMDESLIEAYGSMDEVAGPLKLINVDSHFINEGYDYHLHVDHDRHSGPDVSHLMESTPADVAEAQQLIADLNSCISTTNSEAEKNQCAIEGGMARYYDLSRDMRFKDHTLYQLKVDTSAMLEFCADRDADAVHEAVEGWGTDEDKLIRILCSLSKRQLRRVDQIYAEKFGKSLREVCDGELGGFFEGSLKYFMKCAMTPPEELDAELLRESMKGWGTNDSLLCEIVCTRTNKELEVAKAAFAESEGKSVEEWVEGDTSGFYTTFLLRCLRADRSEGYSDQGLAERQADQLHAAGLGGGDINEQVILNILPRASEEQIALIRNAYEAKFGTTMVDAIKAMGGDMERPLLARVNDKLTYYATVLNNAFSGLGTDEKATSRVLGRNTKCDVNRIGERYAELFGGSLRQAINRETSGNYKKALLTYIFAEGPGEADEAAIETAPAEDAVPAEEPAPAEEAPPEEDPGAAEEAARAAEEAARAAREAAQAAEEAARAAEEAARAAEAAAQAEEAPPSDVVVIEDVEIPKSVALGFLEACRSEYIDGMEGAVGTYFDENGVDGAHQEKLCIYEEIVRDSDDKEAVLSQTAQTWGVSWGVRVYCPLPLYV
eukprot:TRINITY_DN5702_c0_g1_i1.p1 TRINITY_DN5702_c0_g1~~TRINITY_DN5702_c0_g1_i1.p1  ORF type:complete len:1058 (-),score=293.92 TRINITY_DN5702_c0_g1_i1:233-3349(-)